MCTLQEEKSVVDEKLLEAETNLKQITLDHSKKVSLFSFNKFLKFKDFCTFDLFTML